MMSDDKKADGRTKPRGRILWVEELVLDLHLHSAMRIEILRHLAARGNDVRLLAMRSMFRYPVTDSTVHVIYVPLRYMAFLQRIFFCVLLSLFLPLYVLAKKTRVIILSQPVVSILAFLPLIPVARCLKIKLVLDVRSTPVEAHGWHAQLYASFCRFSYAIANRGFDLITVITPFMRDDVAKAFKIDPKSMRVWSDGVSTQLFDPSSNEASGRQLRLQHGLEKSFIVLYHGVMTEHRGIIELVKSVSMLKGRYEDVIVVLLGDGPIVPSLRKLTQELGLERQIVFHGRVKFTEVPKYIAMSDVGIIPLPNLPDWRGQCPNNLLENLAMEKPVILTDIPGSRLVVGDSKCATYVSDANPRQFAEAIMLLHDKRKQLKHLGRSGRAIIKEKYDWKVVAALFENLIG
jgi:phosphatidylinositol alpha-1,6-mannosyltransferase